MDRTEREQHIELPCASPGSRRHLTVLHYGSKAARPQAYLQTGLHADELPGMLVMRQLADRLDAAEREGRMRGGVTLVPLANPIGLAQHVHGRLLGRYDLASGQNFNRGYPELAAGAAERVGGRLGTEASANVALIRHALATLLAERQAEDELDVLRLMLMRLAVDSDICLDLHCDSEAVLHLYLGTPLWPDAADLSAQLGARATLLATVSGGNPFDEAVGGVWWALADQFPDASIPAACLSATVELRGQLDVSEELARGDADNLYRFLARRGVIEDDAGPLPPALSDATPLEGVDVVRSPRAGLLCYRKTPGDAVRPGDVVATVFDPAIVESAPVELVARVSGVLYARRAARMVRPGDAVCRIAGARPLPERVGKHLLGD